MNFKTTALIISSLALSACGGINTFHEYARAGDTVAVPVGMQPDFSKDNITVTITPASGPNIVLTAANPTIRGVMNLYPDPVSNMLVSRAIGENTSIYSQTYASSLLSSTGNDKDWYQTTVFLDLPSTLPNGLTQVEINNGLGATHTVTLQIIPGTGVANNFNSDFDGGLILNPDILDSLGRAPHTTVTLGKTAGQPNPHAVEITLTHDLDNTVGGTGKASVINPLGYLKNVSWSDDGTNMKIIMMRSNEATSISLKDYKFYVAGTATNLAFNTIKGYDINGVDVTVASGLNATLTPSN